MKLIFSLYIICCSAALGQKADFKLTANPTALQRQEILTHLKKVSVYNLHYKSFDGTKVKGFLIAPADTTRSYPVVIYNRGGNGSYAMVQEPFILNFLARISASGYIVIGSQLRGSEGSEGTDEFGGKDVGDVAALLDIIDEVPYAYKRRIGQIGWSRGGITNFLMLKITDRIKTSVNIAGPADLMKSREKMFAIYRTRIPGYAKDSIAVLKRLSQVNQIDSIQNKKVSLLFIHGAKDVLVDVSNSRQLHEAAGKAAIRSELLFTPRGSRPAKTRSRTLGCYRWLA